MLEMDSLELFDSFSSQSGQNKEFRSLPKDSLTSSAKYIKRKSNSDRKVLLLFTVVRVSVERVSLSL